MIETIESSSSSSSPSHRINSIRDGRNYSKKKNTSVSKITTQNEAKNFFFQTILQWDNRFIIFFFNARRLWLRKENNSESERGWKMESVGKNSNPSEEREKKRTRTMETREKNLMQNISMRMQNRNLNDIDYHHCIDVFYFFFFSSLSLAFET